MHGQASLLNVEGSSHHLQVQEDEAALSQYAEANKNSWLLKFGCGLAGLMLIGVLVWVPVTLPSDIESASRSTQIQAKAVQLAFRPSLPVGIAGSRPATESGSRTFRAKGTYLSRPNGNRITGQSALQMMQGEDDDDIDRMTFLRQRTQLSDFTYQLDESAQEDNTGSPFNSTDYFRQKFPPMTLAGVGMKELLHVWERSVRTGEETRRERNRRSHRLLVKSILSVMKKMQSDLPPEDDVAELPVLPDHRRRRRRRQNGIESVGLISSDAFADDVSVVALASFSRGQLEYISRAPPSRGSFRSLPSTTEGDMQDALHRLVDSQLGMRAGVKVSMDMLLDGVSNVSVLSIGGLVQPELSFRSARALLDKIAEWAKIEQRLLVVGRSAVHLSDGTDLTAYYTGLGFVEMQLSDTSNALIYMPASGTLVMPNDTSIWADNDMHNLRSESLAMEECMRGLHIRREWMEADLFTANHGQVYPGTPDGMFEERDGSLTCVQVVRIPVPLCDGSACTFAEQEDVIYETVKAKIEKSQAWMKASGTNPHKFVIFCWCQGWPDNGVHDRALYLVNRMRQDRWPFLLRFMVPSEPGAIFPQLYGFPDNRYIPVRGLFMARLRQR